jgi:hypothetical protein
LYDFRFRLAGSDDCLKVIAQPGRQMTGLNKNPEVPGLEHTHGFEYIPVHFGKALKLIDI